MQRMKRMSFLFGLAVVAASATLPAATVSVSSFKGTVYGPGEAVLAFTDVDAAQELFLSRVQNGVARQRPVSRSQKASFTWGIPTRRKRFSSWPKST